MKLISDSIVDGAPIPDRFAFARPHPERRIEPSDNLNPHLAWSAIPAGTRSFVVICHDPDVPSSAEHVNRADAFVDAALPRVDFCHWLLLDIDGSTRHLDAGRHSAGVTPRGKPGPGAPDGLRHGINDYTAWFQGDAEMGGTYHGYDGPCPPWNDRRVHRYVFTVYALDVERLEIDAPIDRASVLAAIDGHCLASASLTGTYTLNPALRPA